jgi:four helix bundle protein
VYKTFKEMPIWHKAMEIAETVHSHTENLPRKEDFGFTSQIRRSALSISANISEAFGRNHTMDKINFYYMARGPLTETQSHLEYGKRVGYMSKEFVEETEKSLIELYNDINKVIQALKESRK